MHSVLLFQSVQAKACMVFMTPTLVVIYYNFPKTFIGHSLKPATLPSRLKIRRNSFAVRVVKPRNSLPKEVVVKSTVRAFEAKLDKFWKDQRVRFNFREELRT